MCKCGGYLQRTRTRMIGDLRLAIYICGNCLSTYECEEEILYVPQ